MKQISFEVIPVLTLLASSAVAYECPIPPTSIDPRLSVKVDLDRKTGLYKYHYTFSNGRSARLPVNFLVIPVDSAPKSVEAPKGWIEDTSKEEGKVVQHSWLTSSKESMIAPGGTKAGYIFVSDKAPGLIPYYTQGKTELLNTVTIDGDEEAAPDCPGFFNDASVLDSMVSGLTQGPVGDRYLSVDIDLKDSSGDRECGPVSPYEDKGKLTVKLKGKKDLEVEDIDLTSLRFGVGKAPIASSRVLGKSNQILLHFDIPKVGIECDRDRVLFLRGKMKNGKEIFGGAPVKTKNCDKRPKRVQHHGKKDHEH